MAQGKEGDDVGINWTNLSFGNLGFEGIKNLSPMSFNVARGRYEGVDFPRAKSVFAELLMPKIADHLARHPEKGFVAALAYMLDGSVEYAHRGIENKSEVLGGRYEKDFYKTCQYIDADSNIECVNSLIMTHQPVGLYLLQEIPCENKKMRSFRVIHESIRDDKLDEKEKKALLTVRKRNIVKSCIEYLRDLGGIEGLSEEELGGVVAILEVIKALDPSVKNIPLQKRTTRKRKADGEKILKFREEPGDGSKKITGGKSKGKPGNRSEGKPK